MENTNKLQNINQKSTRNPLSVSYIFNSASKNKDLQKCMQKDKTGQENEPQYLNSLDICAQPIVSVQKCSGSMLDFSTLERNLQTKQPQMLSSTLLIEICKNQAKQDFNSNFGTKQISFEEKIKCIGRRAGKFDQCLKGRSLTDIMKKNDKIQIVDRINLQMNRNKSQKTHTIKAQQKNQTSSTNLIQNSSTPYLNQTTTPTNDRPRYNVLQIKNLALNVRTKSLKTQKSTTLSSSSLQLQPNTIGQQHKEKPSIAYIPITVTNTGFLNKIEKIKSSLQSQNVQSIALDMDFDKNLENYSNEYTEININHYQPLNNLQEVDPSLEHSEQYIQLPVTYSDICMMSGK